MGEIVGIVEHQPLGDGVGAGLAQRVGLRLAAPLRDRLGEIGEESTVNHNCAAIWLSEERRAGRREVLRKTSGSSPALHLGGRRSRIAGRSWRGSSLIEGIERGGDLAVEQRRREIGCCDMGRSSGDQGQKVWPVGIKADARRSVRSAKAERTGARRGQGSPP